VKLHEEHRGYLLPDKERPPKSPKRKLITWGIVLSCVVFVWFYFFAPIPGRFFGDIRDIPLDSKITIRQDIITPTGIGVDINWDTIEHELNAAQKEKLRDLFRNSQYSRNVGNIMMGPVMVTTGGVEIERLDNFAIFFNDPNLGDFKYIRISWEKFIIRDNRRQNLRIRNDDFIEQLKRILEND
jgi:hypothetical protein